MALFFCYQFGSSRAVAGVQNAIKKICSALRSGGNPSGRCAPLLSFLLLSSTRPALSGPVRCAFIRNPPPACRRWKRCVRAPHSRSKYSGPFPDYSSSHAGPYRVLCIVAVGTLVGVFLGRSYGTVIQYANCRAVGPSRRNLHTPAWAGGSISFVKICIQSAGTLPCPRNSPTNRRKMHSPPQVL